MSPNESLHYAIGLLAFSVAKADGEVQRQERLKFHNIVAAGLRTRNQDFDISEIIFQVMDRDHSSTEDAYNWAINEIRQYSHYLSPEMKECFIRVMEKVARAFPPVTQEESGLMQRFMSDITPLVGDPLFYMPEKV